MDPQVPTQRALAIAGERIAGGVGVHETALASPEVVDLGGRVVLPGLHRLARALPHLGALAHRGGARRLRVARGGARADPGRGTAARRSDPRLRLAERRLGGRRRADRRAARRGDRRRAGGDDREGLPLALAQLGGARSRERRPRGGGRRGRARRARRADGRAARGGGVALQGAAPRGARRRVRRRDARGAEGRGVARRDRRARQGRLARGAPALAAARAGGDADAAGVAVGPGRPGRGAAVRRRLLGARLARFSGSAT